MKSLKSLLFCGLIAVMAAGGAWAAGNEQMDVVFGPGTTAEQTPEWWHSLGYYRSRNIPVYYAACQTRALDHDRQGRQTVPYYLKEVIFFPAGSSLGSYVRVGTDRRGKLNDRPWTSVNHARLAVKSRVAVEGMVQGGTPEIVAAQLTAEILLRKGLKLIQPKDFVLAVNAPAPACTGTVGPDYDDMDVEKSLDRLYRNQGWTTPPPLPGR